MKAVGIEAYRPFKSLVSPFFRQGLFSEKYVTVIVERIYVALQIYLSTALVYAGALLR